MIKPLKISVVMIVKNEEENLAACLTPLRDLVDEHAVVALPLSGHVVGARVGPGRDADHAPGELLGSQATPWSSP